MKFSLVSDFLGVKRKMFDHPSLVSYSNRRLFVSICLKANKNYCDRFQAAPSPVRRSTGCFAMIEEVFGKTDVEYDAPKEPISFGSIKPEADLGMSCAFLLLMLPFLSW